jgi:hypothetical protein
MTWDRICLTCRRALPPGGSCGAGHEVRPIDDACVAELARGTWRPPAKGRRAYLAEGAIKTLVAVFFAAGIVAGVLRSSATGSIVLLGFGLIVLGILVFFAVEWWSDYPRQHGHGLKVVPGRVGTIEADGDAPAAETTWFLARDGTVLLVAGACRAMGVRLDGGDLVELDAGACDVVAREAGRGRIERRAATAALSAIAPPLLSTPLRGWPMRPIEPAEVRSVQVRCGDRVSIAGELVDSGRDAAAYRQAAGKVWRFAGVPRLRIE